MPKKNIYVSYNQMQGEVIEIRIKSFNGKVLQEFKFNAKDTKRYGNIINDIYRKYGYKPTIPYSDSVAFQESEKKKAMDIEDIDFFG